MLPTCNSCTGVIFSLRCYAPQPLAVNEFFLDGRPVLRAPSARTFWTASSQFLKWATKTKRPARALMPCRGLLIIGGVHTRSLAQRLSAVKRASSPARLGIADTWPLRGLAPRHQAWGMFTLRSKGGDRCGRQEARSIELTSSRVSSRRVRYPTKYFRPLAASTGVRIPIEFVTHRTLNL